MHSFQTYSMLAFRYVFFTKNAAYQQCHRAVNYTNNEHSVIPMTFVTSTNTVLQCPQQMTIASNHDYMEVHIIRALLLAIKWNKVQLRWITWNSDLSFFTPLSPSSCFVGATKCIRITQKLLNISTTKTVHQSQSRISARQHNVCS